MVDYLLEILQRQSKKNGVKAVCGNNDENDAKVVCPPFNYQLFYIKLHKSKSRKGPERYTDFDSLW